MPPPCLYHARMRHQTRGVVTGTALLGHTQVDADVTGGTVQCALAVQVTEDAVVVPGRSACLTAFTSTGITAPVFRLKVLCPRTRRIDEISPECDVTDTNASFFGDAEVKNTSLRAFVLRASCAALVSAVTPFHSSSSSVKPASMGHEGNRDWM